ncbi:Uncharacterized protein FKW44_005833 [Caligus rogercresseyi]|uniref:Uncharacterized protein n=1 Tax=Caligus rogercresseyi TaxID=217165 RepID=A0A7T8KCH8_CALRO|nr:Uncharacterized protein FKW44_005833 [Caligus rogercresseyi]
MTTLKPDTPEEVLEAKEDLLKSNPLVFNTKTWKAMRGKPKHIHMIDVEEEKKPKPCLVSRPSTHGQPRATIQRKRHGGYQQPAAPHTSRIRADQLRLTPPSPRNTKARSFHPCTRARGQLSVRRAPALSRQARRRTRVHTGLQRR